MLTFLNVPDDIIQGPLLNFLSPQAVAKLSCTCHFFRSNLYKEVKQRILSYFKAPLPLSVQSLIFKNIIASYFEVKKHHDHYEHLKEKKFEEKRAILENETDHQGKKRYSDAELQQPDRVEKFYTHFLRREACRLIISALNEKYYFAALWLSHLPLWCLSIEEANVYDPCIEKVVGVINQLQINDENSGIIKILSDHLLSALSEFGSSQEFKITDTSVMCI